MPPAFTPETAATLATQGHATLPGLYCPAEVAAVLACVEAAPASGPGFRRSQDVFAIRNLLGEVPGLWLLLDTPALRGVLAGVFPQGCRLTKSIYFDKPAGSNWLVAWHQDLMVNVQARADVPGYGPWTSKAGWVAVQPPTAVLAQSCTLRLHLDDCDATNGALRVVPGSHQWGVVPATDMVAHTATAAACPVPAGGVMLMRPLLLHASHRSTSPRPRRVVHLEFSSAELADELRWREGFAVGAER